ncbi:MAG: MarR family transcriptional regulator [Vallitaleaceae bacterium]|nr:MarR family transcriptional regulator [Vallitaleaceae bacterium]
MDNFDQSYKVLQVFHRLKETMRQKMEAQCGEMNLTGPQGMLIGILSHFGEMKVSDLSEKMGLSNSTVSGIIDRLEIQELVERRRSTEDKRVVFVNLSKKGSAKIKMHFKSFGEYVSSAMKSATQEEMEKIVQGFEILDQVITRSNQINNQKE